MKRKCQNVYIKLESMKTQKKEEKNLCVTCHSVLKHAEWEDRCVRGKTSYSSFLIAYPTTLVLDSLGTSLNKLEIDRCFESIQS